MGNKNSRIANDPNYANNGYGVKLIDDDEHQCDGANTLNVQRVSTWRIECRACKEETGMQFIYEVSEKCPTECPRNKEHIIDHKIVRLQAKDFCVAKKR